MRQQETVTGGWNDKTSKTGNKLIINMIFWHVYWVLTKVMLLCFTDSRVSIYRWCWCKQGTRGEWWFSVWGTESAALSSEFFNLLRRPWCLFPASEPQHPLYGILNSSPQKKKKKLETLYRVSIIVHRSLFLKNFFAFLIRFAEEDRRRRRWFGKCLERKLVARYLILLWILFPFQETVFRSLTLLENFATCRISVLLSSDLAT